MLRFFYNGIKGEDNKLQKCSYSYGNLHGKDGETTITIYATDYRFSDEIKKDLVVTDNSKHEEDYVCKDIIYLKKGHDYFKAAMEALISQEKKILTRAKKNIEAGKKYYSQADIDRMQAAIVKYVTISVEDVIEMEVVYEGYEKDIKALGFTEDEAIRIIEVRSKLVSIFSDKKDEESSDPKFTYGEIRQFAIDNDYLITDNGLKKVCSYVRQSLDTDDKEIPLDLLSRAMECHGSKMDNSELHMIGLLKEQKVTGLEVLHIIPAIKDTVSPKMCRRVIDGMMSKGFNINYLSDND